MYPNSPRPLPQPHAGARFSAIFFGIVAGLLAAAMVMLLSGSTVAGVVTGVAVFATAGYAAIWASRAVSRAVATGLLILAIGTGWWLAAQGLAIYRALQFTAGPADPADPGALAAAEDKLEGIEGSGAFRVELTEEEIQAVIQNGLTESETPLARIDIDIVDGHPHGTMRFHGDFKNGELEMNGEAVAVLNLGRVQIELVSLDVGSLEAPGLAGGAIEDIVESLADLNGILAENRAEVQSITLADDRLVVTGIQAGEETLTATALLEYLRIQASDLAAVVDPPPERLGWGIVNGLTADGDVYYVALGDSLAANVGVASAREGYVSRLHRQLERHHGSSYGLRNFGVTGETSGTMLSGGQLDEAIEFMSSHTVAYVTIDVGANDLLGHLGSLDCSEGISAPACATRIDNAFAAYRQNLETILSQLRAAAPEATIVFLGTYNPFSLGFGASVTFEAQSDATVAEFNELAAEISYPNGILVADGLAPMQGTTAVTTHMLDDPPDIHPIGIGYDVLAVAVMEAIGIPLP